ncbi:MAG: chorismate-binding protein [Bacteroidales bacterium]
MKHNKSACIDAASWVLHELMKKNIPMACYRLPGEDSFQVVLQTSGEPVFIRSHAELNYEQGFVITPFVQEDEFRAFLIRPDIFFIYPSCEPIAELSDIIKIPTVDEICSDNDRTHETTREEFIDQIKVSQSYLREGQLQKIVLSRIAIEPREPTLALEDIFMSLCHLYPEAFVYFFRLPDRGCWMGATPEPFLVVSNQKGLIESVAGTQWLNGQQPEEIVWGRKELEEQEIVTRFIENRLHLLGIQAYQKEGPATTRAGRLAHLRTRFTFSEKLIENRIGEFIHTFHPTPSVGGYPQQEACRFIASLEKHKREFYTGLVGPLRMNEKTALFANIRCMKIVQNAYWLYLGAGITQASVPELEWEETNFKKTTILAAVKRN